MAEIHKFTPNLFAAHCGLCRFADEAADGVKIAPNVGKLKLNEASVFVKCEQDAGGITMNTWAAAKYGKGDTEQEMKFNGTPKPVQCPALRDRE